MNNFDRNALLKSGRIYCQNDETQTSNRNMRNCEKRINEYKARTNDNYIRVCQLNIQSLRSKIPDLCYDIQANTILFDVLLLSETWLKPEIPTRFLNIPNYTVIRHDRQSTSSQSYGYGGVAVIIRETIPHKIINVTTMNRHSNIEVLWVKARIRDLTFVIGSVYRPPVYTVGQVHDDLDDFEEQLQEVICEYKHAKILIGGDFNACLLKAQLPANKLRQTMSNYNMTICNTTKPTYALADSLLDIVAVSNGLEIVDTHVHRCHYGTPHHFTMVNIKHNEKKSDENIKYTRNYQNINIPLCITILRQSDWIPFYSSKSIETKYDYFVHIFSTFLNLFLPAKQVRIRNTHRRPLPLAIRSLYEKRRYALRNKMAEEYRRLNKECKIAIRRYFAASISERLRRRPNDMWRECEHIIGTKKRTNRTTHDANELNDQYLHISTSISQGIPDCDIDIGNRLPRVNTGYLELTAINMESLTKIIQNMKPSTTEDADGISMKSIITFYDGICHILLDIVNESLITCEVPSRLKHAIIVPVPKGKNDTRPISILPPVMKIIEKVVQLQLTEFIEDHNILSDSHHGYRKNHSCETALATISDTIYQAMQERKATIITSIDLSKCFDIVHHDLLLQKIRSYNIDERWFRHYLQNHTQQVRIQQPGRYQLSSTRPTTPNLSIFQGGSLSCVLFLLFSNDLSTHTAGRLQIVQYADDTTFMISTSRSELNNTVHYLEQSLRRIHDYFTSNKLKINHEKTQIMTAGTKYLLKSFPAVTLRFLNTDIGEQNTIKLLGVTLDKHLNFEEHVNKLAHKSSGMLIALNNAKTSLPEKTHRPLINAFIMSTLSYCITIYGTTGPTQLNKLQKVLNFCARILTKRRKCDHISDAFIKLGIPTINELFTINRKRLVLNILRTHTPNFLYNTIERRNGLRTTRRNDIIYPKIITDAGRKRINYDAARYMYGTFT